MARVKQFYAAVTAELTAEDRAFVFGILSAEEGNLFWQMNLPDQQHSLRVAQTALKLAQKEKTAIDRMLLLRAALLHDVGKQRGDVSTADKVITVLGHMFLPKLMHQWEKEGRGNKLDNLRHAFYIYWHHPKRSAALLEAIGEPIELIEMVRAHHEAPQPEDRRELILLRRADSMH